MNDFDKQKILEIDELIDEVDSTQNIKDIADEIEEEEEEVSLSIKKEESITIDDSGNLEPEVRVGGAVYMEVLNSGIMTNMGVLLPNALNMTQIAKQAEVSVNFAIKALSNIRKMGFIKNRRDDGRLLIKLAELEVWLKTNGFALDN